jgi:3-oxoacyl-[acyl-carrier-protein] synthase III
MRRPRCIAPARDRVFGDGAGAVVVGRAIDGRCNVVGARDIEVGQGRRQRWAPASPVKNAATGAF